ncbi:MAG: endonuclease III, partial [Clostridia bacterium]|nr:endonuclease III [Clostridia bacterium]
MHPQAVCELDYKSPFELLVAVILSAQCTDKRVNQVTEKLFKVYNTPKQFAELEEEQLAPYIYSCGFYRNKAKNIISASRDIMTKFGGEVPNNIDELIT